MDDHIVHHVFRAPQQQAVEIQVSLCGAAAPQGFLFFHGDPSVGHSDLPGPFRRPGRDHLPAQLHQILQLSFGKLWYLCPRADFFQCLFDPRPFAFQYPPDLRLRCAQRRPDGDPACIVYPDPDGLPPAADHLYFPGLHPLHPISCSHSFRNCSINAWRLSAISFAFSVFIRSFSRSSFSWKWAMESSGVRPCFPP